MNLIKILTAESQKNNNVYKLIDNFYIILNSSNWIKKYIFWELELFKILGYDLDLENLIEKKVEDSKIRYITKSHLEKKTIPNFLIDKNEKIEDIKSLLEGLRLVGDYLEKSIIRPNNMNFPISRINFVNTLK